MDTSNVETLKRFGASVCELALDLHKAGEAGEVLEALIIVRDSEGILSIQYTPMDTAGVAEIAAYLSAHAQVQVWNENEAPRMETEGESCDED